MKYLAATAAIIVVALLGAAHFYAYGPYGLMSRDTYDALKQARIAFHVANAHRDDGAFLFDPRYFELEKALALLHSKTTSLDGDIEAETQTRLCVDGLRVYHDAVRLGIGGATLLPTLNDCEK